MNGSLEEGALAGERGQPPPPPGRLDLVLRWADAAAPAPRPMEDLFEEKTDLDAAAEVRKVAAAPPEQPAGEGFQWTRDREQALESALRQMADTPLACVHRQLDEIRAALEMDRLAPARARGLLDEVEAWLHREIQRRSARPASRDERVREARSRTADALHSYQDLADLLRGFLDSRNPAELVLARRLGDLAAGFLLQAREELLQTPEESAEDRPAPQGPPSD